MIKEEKEELDSDKVFVLHKFLTSDECVALIRWSEGLTYVQPDISRSYAGRHKRTEDREHRKP